MMASAISRTRPGVRALAVWLVSGLACGTAALAAQPPLLAPLPGFDIPPTGQGKAVVREEAVSINLAALPSPDGAAGTLIQIDLFPDLQVSGVIETVEHGGSGADLYRGRLTGRPGGSFTLARSDGVLVGDVRLGMSGLFELRALPIGAMGAHVVRQIDESLLPPCATGPEHAVDGADDEPAGGLRGEVGGGDTGSVFDVLVMYTPLARDAAGGRAAIEALIDLGVSNTNLSYTNSGIPSQVNVVHRGVIDYTETANASTELSRFRGTGDGNMDGVHCLRDAYGADFCALIVDEFNACGIGYLMSSPGSSFATSAFSVTARGCLSSYTFAHELGHNQGSHHDRDNAGSQPAYSYSYGYRTPGEQFRTVMSYAPGTRIPYFSTPLVSYQGFVLGIAEGAANSADNARSIRETAPVVALFRASRGVMNPIERLSVSSSGVQATLASGLDRPAISDSGAIVAFTTLAANLSTGDTNTEGDIYVQDAVSGLTLAQSVPSGAGTQAAMGGLQPSLAADGRRFVFASDSPSLIVGDSNGHRDIFLRDRQTSQTTRVSVGPGGVQADGPSNNPVLARSSLIAAFDSTASNLHFAGGNGLASVFVRNISTNATARVSNGLGGVHPDGPSTRPHLSADGRYVVFESVATNLVSGDGNGHSDIFLHDRTTQQTTRISLGGAGQEASGPSFAPRVSADGRFVAFESDAGNLVSNDTNNARDVFLHDRETGAVRRVSVTATGGQIAGASSLQDLSADGRFVAFITASAGVVPNDFNGHADLFRRDVAARQTRRVSLGWINQQFNGPVLNAALSASGRHAVLTTTAVNAVPCDGNGNIADVLKVDLGAPGPTPCPTDYETDGTINSADISAFLTTWLASIDGATADGDFNGDGTINSTDISAFLTAWLGSLGGGC